MASFSVAHENGQCQIDLQTPKPIYARFQGTIVNSKKIKSKNKLCRHFDYRWEAENLIRSSPYS